MNTRRQPTSGVQRSFLLWAMEVARGRWRYLLGVMGVMIVRVGFDLLRPWPMKILVDHVLEGKPLSRPVAALAGMLPGAATGRDLILWLVIALVLIFLAGRLLNIFGTVLSVGLGQRLTFDVAGALFRHLQRLSICFHHRRALGDTMRRVTGDSSCVATLIKDAFLPLLMSLLTLIAIFVILWQLNAVLTLASLVVVPFLLIVLWRYAKPMMEQSYAQQEAEGEIYAVIERTLSAVPVVQAFAREDEANARYQTSTTASLQASLAATRTQLLFKFFVGLSTAAGTALIMWIGAEQVMAGKLTVGGVFVFLSYLAALYAPLEATVYTSSTIQAATGSARRVLELLESEPDVQERPDAEPLPKVHGDVRFEGVTFGYEPDRPVLHGISLEVHRGQTMAIVGATGAGKSTLVSLIPRFFDPWEGRVTIDGQDLRDVRLRDLRRQVAVVLQEPFLFPMSVAENIAYGRPEATRDEIEAAARAANAHDFIIRLESGYDTVVGERGGTLSGGERQRVSIARALVTDAPILILDEPTSAVDAETERLVVQALRRLMAGRTTFIIAHRLSTVRHADRIVVLEAGRIAEAGTHEELLQLNGTFARLHRLNLLGNGGHGKEPA